jgi:hypothetical protein
MPGGSECHSPACNGAIVPDREIGVPVDPHVGKCSRCGLRYLGGLGGWTLVGPVIVNVWGREPLRCSCVSFEPEGVVLLIDGAADEVIPAEDLLGIAPSP